LGPSSPLDAQQKASERVQLLLIYDDGFLLCCFSLCVVDMQEDEEEKGFLACIGNARRQSILAGVFL
jgi:hypothetical protein